MRSPGFLLGEGPFNRKAWIENRLEELAQIFAVTVGGFSVLDNHLHLLVRLDPDSPPLVGRGCRQALGSALSAARQCCRVLPVSDEWVRDRLAHPLWVATAGAQLKSLSWFMKCLKEPLARLANRQDKTSGAFFEKRFRSIAVLDDEALLSMGVYIDLNPVAAGIEQSAETS